MLIQLGAIYSSMSGLTVPDWTNMTPAYYESAWKPYLTGVFSQNSFPATTMDGLDITDHVVLPTSGTLTGSAVLAPDGRIYFSGAGTLGTSIYRLTPGAPPTVTTHGSFAATNNSGLILGPDGNLYSPPFSGSSVMKIVPGDTPVITNHGIFGVGTSGKYRSGVLASDGNIYCPSDNSSYGKIMQIVPGDPPTITEYASSGLGIRSCNVTTGGQIYGVKNTQAFNEDVTVYYITPGSPPTVQSRVISTIERTYLHPPMNFHMYTGGSNKVFLPFSGRDITQGTGIQFGMIVDDTDATNETLITVGSSATGTFLFNSACFLHDGSILCPNYNGSQHAKRVSLAGIYGTLFGTATSGSFVWACAVMAPDGAIYQFPYDCSTTSGAVRRVAPNGNATIGANFPLEALLSGWLKGM